MEDDGSFEEIQVRFNQFFMWFIGEKFFKQHYFHLEDSVQTYKIFLGGGRNYPFAILSVSIGCRSNFR